MKNKLYLFISWIIIGFSMVFVVVITYWSAYPYRPLTFNTLPHKVLNNTLKAGDNLIYRVDYCKDNNLDAIVSKTFADDIVYPTLTTISNRPQGCHQLDIVVPIPESLPVGNYKLMIVYRFRVNPIRNIDVNAETEQFTIIK